MKIQFNRQIEFIFTSAQIVVIAFLALFSCFIFTSIEIYFWFFLTSDFERMAEWHFSLSGPSIIIPAAMNYIWLSLSFSMLVWLFELNRKNYPATSLWPEYFIPVFSLVVWFFLLTFPLLISFFDGLASAFWIVHFFLIIFVFLLFFLPLIIFYRLNKITPYSLFFPLPGKAIRACIFYVMACCLSAYISLKIPNIFVLKGLLLYFLIQASIFSLRGKDSSEFLYKHTIPALFTIFWFMLMAELVNGPVE